MALKHSKLQQIPQRNKDLAFGYVNKSEKANKSTIPSMIKYLCLVYLNQNKDEFDEENTHKDIKIDGNTVKALKCGIKCTYLRNLVSTGVHQWRFKCGCTTEYPLGDIIGIIRINDKSLPLDVYFDCAKKRISAYAFGVAGKVVGDGIESTHGNIYGGKCEINDIIEMTLDFNELTLSYKINQIDYGKAFDIIPGEYRAAMTFFPTYPPNSCYTLISYQHIY